MTSGVLAKKIMASENDDKDLIDNAFMGGILHDLGKLVLASKFPDKYLQIIHAAAAGNASISDQEREIFGVTHSELGAYLTGLWGLPAGIIEAIARHHSPSTCMIRQLRPLTAVHVANAMLLSGHPADQEGEMVNFDGDYLTGLNLTNRIPKWKKIYAEHKATGEAGGS